MKNRPAPAIFFAVERQRALADDGTKLADEPPLVDEDLVGLEQMPDQIRIGYQPYWLWPKMEPHQRIDRRFRLCQEELERIPIERPQV